MIVRPQQHWLQLIFVWHGSVLPKIYTRLLLNFLLSIAVIVMLPWYTSLGIKFTVAPFSILGVAIAIFLGFKNNACYSRYVEARQLWGQLMIAARSLFREVKNTLPDDPHLGEFVRLQIAFAHCLRMLTSQRKQLILEKLQAEGQVQSKALSMLFTVSEDTIRRDLRELAAEGRLQRVHGGALPSSSAIAPFAERQSLKMDAKKRVARKGAQLISPGQVVIIDGGTTTSELITFLPSDLNITVVTHSPGIALGLVNHPAIEVILIGGRLYKHSIVTVGAAAIEGIGNIHEGRMIGL